MLTKHRTVLHRLDVPGVSDVPVRFVQHTDDGEMSESVAGGITLSAERYADLGEPEVITVSIEPGDLLNV